MSTVYEKRILEKVDSEGKSKFYLQYKDSFLWHFYWVDYENYELDGLGLTLPYDTLEEAKKWLFSGKNTQQIVHEVNE
jgi:hypothetical protein